MKLSVHGREVHVYTGGRPFDPALPCVVFLHGAIGDHTVWTLLARWAAHHGHAVLAPDLPGHLRSAGPALARVEALADWTLALLDAAGVARASLVGHSMGSLIALEAAAKAPGRAQALVMIGTCAPMPVPEALLALAREDVHAAIDRVTAFSFSTLANKPSYPGPGTWLHGAARALARQVVRDDPSLFVTDFGACNAYAGGLEAAERVAAAGVPATLLLGSQDQMTLARAAAPLAKALGARVETLPVGHYLMQEAPDDVLNRLREALAHRQVAPAPEPAGAPR